MSIREDFLCFLKYLKKYAFVIITLYILVEAYIIFTIGNKYTFMAISSIFVSLFIICTLILLYKDFTTTLLIYSFSIPLLPMASYLFSRLNVLWIGDVINVLYIFIFLHNVGKEMKKGNFDFSRIAFKGKYRYVTIVYIILTILGISSAVNSSHIKESLGFFLLGYVSMFIYSIVLLCYKKMDPFIIKKIMLYLIIGVVVSGIPDAIVSVYYIISINANQHLYGPLGSNFILGYTIIVLPYLLYKTMNEDKNSEDRLVYILLVITEVFILSTQMSRGILLTITICLVLVIISDRKNWYKYLIFGVVVLFCIRYNVLNRWELSDLKNQLNNKGLTKTIETQLGDKNILVNFILKQSGTRRDIWAIAFNVINDNPKLGVGLGNFKYYYLTYGGEIERSYKDSHNIVLDIMTDFGIPFTIIFFSSIITATIKSFHRSLRSKNIFVKSSLVFCIIGIINLFIYGNITGQAFMTFIHPISTVPAFVFTIIITMMIIITRYEVGDIE
jgi:O-antigen ligase